MPIRPLQHFGSAIAASSKPPRLTSRLNAFGPECVNGLPLELFGAASRLPFLLRAPVRRHRRAHDVPCDDGEVLKSSLYCWSGRRCLI
jgi:hypothetical protein